VGVLTPEYPPFARSNRIQGRVTLQIQVYRDGSVGDIKILKSDSPLLNDAAIAAIKKVRFQPGKSGGNPVDTTVNIPIDFRLN
ncbi:MAG: energy transducer TonB, partial [Candidatus Cloacimonetes bacterium]|nr:energy transducer TonB [Candidatus Cloacimonadota bacterium]